MIEETRRNKLKRINVALESIEDKSVDYCYDCLYLENKIIKLDNCKVEEHHNKGFNNFKISFCKEENKMTCHTLKGKCKSCIGKKYGLGNPNIHQQTINNQIKNGTFNMMNSKIQKNKISNENIKFKDETKFCKICNKETHHKIWSNGNSSCRICDAKNNGLKSNIVLYVRRKHCIIVVYVQNALIFKWDFIKNIAINAKNLQHIMEIIAYCVIH